jgi:hypothetical protein
VNAVEHAHAAAAGYRHVDKLAKPKTGIMLGGATLKWYDMAPADAPVPLAVRALARRCLRDGVKHGELALDGELGFVILHRCEDDFYFLLVSTWRNENELWESVWAKAGSVDVLFRPWTVEGSHRPTFCVWELGAVAHERRAWTAYLRSGRDRAARDTYLRDAYDGAV